MTSEVTAGLWLAREVFHSVTRERQDCHQLRKDKKWTTCGPSGPGMVRQKSAAYLVNSTKAAQCV
jgi:hypothetical protein